MKKTTVVFDLDGTLLDTLQDLANAVNYALEQQGMPKRTLEEVRQFVGNGVRLLMIRAVPDGENNPLFEETFALFKEYYGEHCNDNTKPYEGVLGLIETLKARTAPPAMTPVPGAAGFMSTRPAPNSPMVS